MGGRERGGGRTVRAGEVVGLLHAQEFGARSAVVRDVFYIPQEHLSARGAEHLDPHTHTLMLLL